MERYELEKLKFQRHFGNITPKYKKALDSEEHGEELRHFEKYLSGEGYASLEVHNVAARIGMLDNIPLAKYLMELEAWVSRISDRLDGIPED